MTSRVQIYLESQFATSSFNGDQNSDLVFLFTTPVVPPVGYNVTFKLLNRYLPVSLNIVNDTNNTLYINSVEYTIPAGNYNATQLADTITDLVSGDLPTFTISFDSITDKYTFTDSTTELSVSGSSLYLLGFSDDTTSSSQTLTSTYPVDVTGD